MKMNRIEEKKYVPIEMMALLVILISHALSASTRRFLFFICSISFSSSVVPATDGINLKALKESVCELLVWFFGLIPFI